jgi:hypothetical protein
MEMNAERTKVLRISKQPFPVQIVIDQKELEHVEYFNYLSSIIINDENVHVKVNPGLPW